MKGFDRGEAADRECLQLCRPLEPFVAPAAIVRAGEPRTVGLRLAEPVLAGQESASPTMRSLSLKP